METELKLRLRPQDLPRLLAHPLLQPLPAPLALGNVYHDTPERDLSRRGLAVRQRRIGSEHLLTVKTAGHTVGGLSTRGEWEGPAPTTGWDFPGLMGDHPLAAELQALSPRLVPRLQTHFTRLRWRLHWQGAYLEVALDQGEVRAGEAVEPLLELEIERLEGPLEALHDLAHTLALGGARGAPGGHTRSHGATGPLALMPEPRSKAERGFNLLDGRAPQAIKAPAVALRADLGPQAAFAQAALDALGSLQANLLGWAEPAQPLPDPEFVHQARVALRRLRTGWRVFAPHLPTRLARHWAERGRALAHVLGPVRNWDVLETETLPPWLPILTTDAAELARVWVREQRLKAHDEARQRLADPGFWWVPALALAKTLTRMAQADPAPDEPLTAWARTVMARQRRRTHRRLASHRRHDLDSWHEVRLDIKRLRYTADHLAGLLPMPKRLMQALTEAQALLGRLNDLHTAQHLLADAPWTVREPLERALAGALAEALHELPARQRELRRRLA